MPQPRQTTCKQYFLPSARGSHEGSFLTANGFLHHNTFINPGQATCPPSRIQRLLICACSQLRLAVLGTDHKLVLLYILDPRAPPNQWGSASKSDFVFTLSANGNTGLNPNANQHCVDTLPSCMPRHLYLHLHWKIRLHVPRPPHPFPTHTYRDMSGKQDYAIHQP